MGTNPSNPALPPHVLLTQIVSDTPPRAKKTAESSYLFSGLSSGRDSLMQEVGSSIPEVPVQTFLERLLPSVREGSVEEVLGKLAGGTEPTIVNGRWSGFDNDPSKSRETEDAVFQPLVKLVDNIVKASSGSKDVMPFLVYRSNPNKSPRSILRDNKSRPDGYFIRSDQVDSPASWAHIAVSAEFKKRDIIDNTRDDMKKVIWSMHQCMREDPCRRFTFGMTIEDTSMRLWYCNRERFLVSEAFDFIQDHRSVVHFFLAMSYSDHCSAGWDPTMTVACLDNQGNPRYDISVRSADGTTRVYRTRRIIFDIGANAVLGRGARVWEVIEVVDGIEMGDPVVLKDLWIDADRTREGDILEKIRNTDPGSPDGELLDEVLLTVKCHGDVLVDNGADHTRKMTRGDVVSAHHSTLNLVRPEPPKMRAGTSRTTTERNTGTSRAATEGRSTHVPLIGIGDHRTHEEHTKPCSPSRTYHPKVHYRIVFGELCEPLYALTSFPDIFSILGQAIIALKQLHKLGWVHRDVSPGNILVIRTDDSLSVKLADLEYAKHMDDQTTHEIRTGTSDFMAVEVDLQQYMFCPPREHGTTIQKPGATDLELFRMMKNRQRQKASFTKINAAEPTRENFRYNPLHDFESVWWIATYFVFNKAIVEVNGEMIAQDEAQYRRNAGQKAYASKLFYTTGGRVATLTPNAPKSNVHLVHESIARIAESINLLKDELVARYSQVEKNTDEISYSVAESLSELFRREFDAAATINVHVGPLIVPDVYRSAAQPTPDQGIPSRRSGGKRSLQSLHDDTDRGRPSLDETGGRSSPTSSAQRNARKKARRTPSLTDGPSAGTRSRKRQ